MSKGFKSAKQRAFFFAKKSGKLPSNPATKVASHSEVTAASNPPNLNKIPDIKIPGLPKKNRFGRIKKNFKMGF